MCPERESKWPPLGISQENSYPHILLQHFQRCSFQSFSSREEIFPDIYLGCNIISPLGRYPKMQIVRIGGEEATSLVWDEGYLETWVILSFADAKPRLPSVNCPTSLSQGSIPNTPLRVPSIGKPKRPYSGPAQCQSFFRAFWLRWFPYLELITSYLPTQFSAFRTALP